MSCNGTSLANAARAVLGAVSVLTLAAGCGTQADDRGGSQSPPSQEPAATPTPTPIPPRSPAPPAPAMPAPATPAPTPSPQPPPTDGIGSPPSEPMPVPAVPSGSAIPPAPMLPEGPGVLLDIDLTKGNAEHGLVVGGAWEDGWRVTQLKGERIVWDLGRPVANGIAEVSFTMKGSPLSNDDIAKLNYAGLHEHESLDQQFWDGDHFYARTGKPSYRFSKVKAFGRRFDRTEWEGTVGALSDWATDDKTVQTVKFEWKEGVAIFHDTKGKAFRCPSSVCNRELPIDHLRYLFVGSDLWIELGVVGIRYKRVKVTDNGGEPIGPPGKMAAYTGPAPKR